MLLILWTTFKHEKGFTVSKILFKTIQFHPEWQIDALPDASIFSQKFTYLGNGTQCFAFVSEDQKYVLKFFKMKHLRDKPRLSQTFGSFKNGYDHFRKEAALLYIHLNPTKNLKIHATLIDKQKKQWKVDLDKVPFVLQEKAEPLYPYLTGLITQNKISSAQEAVQSIIDLVTLRCEKGFVDLDDQISRNYGFVESRPVQFDIGRIVAKPNDGEEIERVKKQLSDLGLF